MSRFPAKKALSVLAAVSAVGVAAAACASGSGATPRAAGGGSRPSSSASPSGSSTDSSTGSSGTSGHAGTGATTPGSPNGSSTGATGTTGGTTPGTSTTTTTPPPIPTTPGYRPPAVPRKNSGVDCSVAKCIALTFDDGPGPDTGRLLDLLKSENVPATFFVLGDQAQKYPGTVRREYAEGHEVGNHTWDHKDMSTLSAAAVQDEIKRGADAIAATGVPRPTLVRPPYGAVNDTVRTYAGYPFIMWRVDPLDWKYPNAARVTDQIVGNAQPGRIVLSHDIHPTTIDAMPAVIQHLKQQGYTFVTVSTLLKGVNLQNGQSYFTRPAGMTGAGVAQAPQSSQNPQNPQGPKHTPPNGSGGNPGGNPGTKRPQPTGSQPTGGSTSSPTGTTSSSGGATSSSSSTSPTSSSGTPTGHTQP